MGLDLGRWAVLRLLYFGARPSGWELTNSKQSVKAMEQYLRGYDGDSEMEFWDMMEGVDDYVELVNGGMQKYRDYLQELEKRMMNLSLVSTTLEQITKIFNNHRVVPHLTQFFKKVHDKFDLDGERNVPGFKKEFQENLDYLLPPHQQDQLKYLVNKLYDGDWPSPPDTSDGYLTDPKIWIISFLKDFYDDCMDHYANDLKYFVALGD